MDAVVFVSPGVVGRWDVYAGDPKGLLLGTIETTGAHLFAIEPQAAPLTGVDEASYPDLGAAMHAVAARIGGTCDKCVP